jgi:hypothetical protein
MNRANAATPIAKVVSPMILIHRRVSIQGSCMKSALRAYHKPVSTLAHVCDGRLLTSGPWGQLLVQVMLAPGRSVVAAHHCSLFLKAPAP